jgi:hypothetical protein
MDGQAHKRYLIPFGFLIFNFELLNVDQEEYRKEGVQKFRRILLAKRLRRSYFGRTEVLASEKEQGFQAPMNGRERSLLSTRVRIPFERHFELLNSFQ